MHRYHRETAHVRVAFERRKVFQVVTRLQGGGAVLCFSVRCVVHMDDVFARVGSAEEHPLRTSAYERKTGHLRGLVEHNASPDRPLPTPAGNVTNHVDTDPGAERRAVVGESLRSNLSNGAGTGDVTRTNRR